MTLDRASPLRSAHVRITPPALESSGHRRSGGWLEWGLLALLLLQGCAALPSLESRTPSVMIRDTADTRLGRAVAPLVESHPDRSGVVALRLGGDAFGARMRMAEAADRSLDVQYYLWHPDLSGTLLLDALRRAAARGVRVRLLLDDNNTNGLDGALAAFAALANVEVRLFNPFAQRGWRGFGFLTDFARLNRRMHNKSYTADNQATIVGGRNVGDEYFGAASDLMFVDLDILAIGPVVRHVSADFDRYWNSASAYPAALLLPPATPEAQAALDRRLESSQNDPAARRYRQAIAGSSFMADLLAGRLAFDWAPVQLVSDDPDKVLGRVTEEDLLWTRLRQMAGEPRSELTLASPYFVPGEQGTRNLAAMAASGVRVSVLTNSLEATDVPAVHSGYAKRRHALLRAGVALYELKRGVDPRASDGAGRSSGLGSAVGSGGSSGSGSIGSSSSSLHTKAFTVDGKLVFVGSFNFDPRSARLNTEMGFVIGSPDLARSMAQALQTRLEQGAYRVRLTDRGELEWVETLDGRQVIHVEEPGTTFWRRLGVSLLSLLPIEWLL
ncbi:MAG: phospholipase D family protein [Burkholderiaceae bacterium]